MLALPPWLALRLRAIVTPGHDREIGRELQAHIDFLTDEYIARGLSPAEARARAHREFGNVTRVQETSHDLFSVRPLESAAKDIGYALREIRRSPGFTAVALISLAVGIGVVTATFTVVDALMVRGLPVRAPDRLVALSATTSSNWSRWSIATFRQWAFSPDAVFDAAAIYNLNDLERPAIPAVGERPRVALVSGNYFDVLDLPMAAGRALSPADDRFPGVSDVVVISYGFCERQFGAAASAIGRSLELNGRLYEIVGVAGKKFAGDWVGHPTDLWLPLSTYPAIADAPADFLSDASSARWLRVIARLHGEATMERAQTSANLLYQRWLSTLPVSAQSQGDRGAPIALLSAATGYAPLRQRYAQPLMIIGVIVALVLLVACANFANLFTDARARGNRSSLCGSCSGPAAGASFVNRSRNACCSRSCPGSWACSCRRGRQPER